MPAITFTVNRNGDLTKAGSVNWLLQGDLKAADLVTGQPTSGSVSWLANEATAKVITINTKGNTADNPDRACIITLSGPVNGVLGTATATTIVLDDDAGGDVTPKGYPYPRSDLWEEVTFPNTLTRLVASADQHPTTPLADGTIIEIACDRTLPAAVYSSLQVVQLSGTYPNLVEDGRMMWGLGATGRAGKENLKCHAIVSLIGNRLLLWYYRLNVTNGNTRSCCVLSTDNGETFAALPAETAAVFIQGSGENFQPRGIIQPGPSYGAVNGPGNASPHYFDRDYIYIAGNNQTQGGVTANRTRQGGLIYLARYKYTNANTATGGSLTMTNLNDRSRYSFYKGVDIDGVPQWTANGGLKTDAGVVPIFSNVIDGRTDGVGYYWQCHWHAALHQWIAVWLPNGLAGVSIAHAPTLWGNKWRMLANNVPLAKLPAAESGYYLGASCPQEWSSATKLGLGLSTFVDSPRAGDDLILTDSSPLVALTS